MNFPRKFNQIGVRWAKGALKADGNTEYSAGVEIACRAENKQQLFVNRIGEDQLSRMLFYMPETQAMNLDDKLYLGTIASLPAGGQANPNIVPKAFRVEAIDDIPNRKNTQTLRMVTL